MPCSRLFNTSSASFMQVAVISFRYLARGSPSFFCSAIATETLPPSSTTCPRASKRASSPATRTADGPMSTPRRDCPRSRGTPITRIFLGMTLENDAVVGFMGLSKNFRFSISDSDSDEFNFGNRQLEIGNQQSTITNSSRVESMQHPGKGNGFPNMLQAADPRYRPFNAHTKPGVWHAA